MSSGVCLLVIVIFVGICLRPSEGISCWVCNGKATLEECHKEYGEMQECNNRDDVCQNDFRTASGRQIITKGCKQRTACRTEVRQNKDKNQCGRKSRNMVCRCCCSTTGCNAKESGCLPPPPPCEKLQNPEGGRAICPGEVRFGTRCSIRCRNGFRLEGPERVTCQRLSKGSKKGKWMPGKPIVCKKIIVKCNPARNEPKNGFVTCTNTKEYADYDGFNYEGSKCTYHCKRHYILKGKEVSICTKGRKWNSEEPTCVKGRCEEPRNDPNRISSCTDGHHFGSDCTFSCRKGFNLIGSTESSCRQIGRSASGVWTKKLPVCAEVTCYPKLTNPANGKVTCSKDNVKGSVCTYTCDEGFDLDDSDSTSVSATCTDDNDGDDIGKWSRAAATCSRIKCDTKFKDPSGGQVTCSDGNLYGSKCTFSCNPDHDLTGTREPTWTTTCKSGMGGNATGEWTEVAADCKPITCEPEFIQESNEQISCTKGNGKDSVCSLSCQTDYVPEGIVTTFVTSECLPPKDGTAVGRWSRVDKPSCIPIACPDLPFPDQGFRICSLFNLRGSFCVFYCGAGYDRIGSAYMMCQKGPEKNSPVGVWSSDQPTCRLGQCPVPKFDEETVVQVCTAPEGYAISEYRVGSVCTYTCKSDAYYMVPNVGFEPVLSKEVTSECNVEKHWTALVPRCLLKTCQPQLTSPNLGYNPKCSQGNEFGSSCTFSCQEKHAPSHNRPLLCTHDGDNDQYGKWSAESPVCERSHCDDFGTVMNGKLNCTDGTKIGSVCTLQCIERYTIKRYISTECLADATWSRRKYFCCVPCLFNNRIKIVMAFDRSTIKRRKDWSMMIAFTKSYLTLMLQYRLQVSFSAFTYADEVDLDTEIPMERIRSTHDIESVAESLWLMSFGGKVSATGESLRYINEVVYKRLDRRREQFVILVTGGRSADDYLEISKAIRDRGINILATGINVRPAGRKQLLQITGNAKNVFTTKNLDDVMQVPQKIFAISRTTGCTFASKSQACP